MWHWVTTIVECTNLYRKCWWAHLDSPPLCVHAPNFPQHASSSFSHHTYTLICTIENNWQMAKRVFWRIIFFRYYITVLPLTNNVSLLMCICQSACVPFPLFSPQVSNLSSLLFPIAKVQWTGATLGFQPVIFGVFYGFSRMIFPQP